MTKRAREYRQPPFVLVVEDDPATAELLSDLLVDEGYRTMQTGSACVAERLIRQYRPVVVLLDLMLSEGSGLDLLRDIKDDPATRDVPVLVISAADQLLRHPVALRADALLRKPFQVASVLKQVERLARPEPEPLGRRLATLSA